MAKTMRAADRRKMTSGRRRGEHVEKLRRRQERAPAATAKKASDSRWWPAWTFSRNCAQRHPVPHLATRSRSRLLPAAPTVRAVSTTTDAVGTRGSGGIQQQAAWSLVRLHLIDLRDAAPKSPTLLNRGIGFWCCGHSVRQNALGFRERERKIACQLNFPIILFRTMQSCHALTRAL